MTLGHFQLTPTKGGPHYIFCEYSERVSQELPNSSYICGGSIYQRYCKKTVQQHSHFWSENFRETFLHPQLIVAELLITSGTHCWWRPSSWYFQKGIIYLWKLTPLSLLRVGLVSFLMKIASFTLQGNILASLHKTCYPDLACGLYSTAYLL